MYKFFLCFIIGNALLTRVVLAEGLKIAIVDVPPFGYSENEKIKGINFDILKELEIKAKLTFEYHLYPHARIINSLSTPGPDLTITFERHCLSNSDLYEVQQIVYTAKPTLYLKDPSKLTKSNLKVGLIRNTCMDVVNHDLINHTPIELISMNQAIKMTYFGRLDGFCGLIPVVDYARRTNKKFHTNLKIVPTDNVALRAVICRKKSLAPTIKQALDLALKDYKIKVNY